MGRMVHGTMAPLPSLQVFFGELARDDQPAHLPDVLGPPCHPIPLHQTLKEGCGGGWGGVRRMENVGIRGRGQDPIPRRSLPS